MNLIEQAARYAIQHPARVIFPDSLDERSVRAAMSWVDNGMDRRFCWLIRLRCARFACNWG